MEARIMALSQRTCKNNDANNSLTYAMKGDRRHAGIHDELDNITKKTLKK